MHMIENINSNIDAYPYGHNVIYVMDLDETKA